MNPENPRESAPSADALPPMATGSLPAVQTSEPMVSDADAGDRYTKNGITLRRKRLKGGQWSKWTTRIRFQNQVHVLTLHETAKESLTVALRAKREIQSGRWAAVKTAVRLRVARVISLAELKKAYFVAPVEASVATRTQNWNALEQLITTVYPSIKLEGLSSSLINGELASGWFKSIGAKIDLEADQAKQATLKRSANSRYSQAASVFTARALAAYKLNEVHHAGFDKFLAAGGVYEFVRIPKTQYLPPSEAIIKATFESWEALTDRELFLAIGHALAFGLRAGEIVQAKWGWWNVREGYPVLDGTGNFKSGTGRLTVRALDPWFTTMRDRVSAKAWRQGDEDYILTGCDTQRWDLVYRAASHWLRDRGWGTQKTNHALRAYAGSQVAMRYGIYEAQTFLRHNSVLVTEQHYSYFVKAFRPADVSTMPVKWATGERTFQPVILPNVATI